MASRSTRAQLVLRSLKLAGRGVELQSEANDWLNDMLDSWSLDYRFPSLRKIGSTITLSQGSTTAPLPSDFGAGMEKQGLLFGVEKTVLDEKSSEEFTTMSGYLQSGNGIGRPTFYTIDKEGKNFVFNCPADQNYPFIPIYYKRPAAIPSDSSGDLQNVWADNDELVVQGLIEKIYQFKEDDREMAQFDKVYNPQHGMLTRWARQVAVMGGTSRIMPSPARFKTVRFY